MTKSNKLVVAMMIGFACEFPAQAGAQPTRPATTRSDSRLNPAKWMAEDRDLLARFQDAMKTAQDPVALAAEAARDPHGETSIAGMDVLLQHPDDPRAERTLEEISKTGRWSIRDGDLTFAGEAGHRLWKMRARREFNKLLAGAETAPQRWQRLQVIFREHPEWLKHDLGLSPESTLLVQLLLEEAEKTGGAEAVDLVAPTGYISHAYAKQHGQALFDYAKKVGRDKAFACPYFVERLMEGKGKQAVPLLEEWLKDAKDTEAIHHLVAEIAVYRDQDWLIDQLHDPRPAVFRWAAISLHRFTDARSAAAVSEAADRLEKSGGDPSDVQFLRNVAKRIHKDVQTQRKDKP